MIDIPKKVDESVYYTTNNNIKGNYKKFDNVNDNDSIKAIKNVLLILFFFFIFFIIVDFFNLYKKVKKENDIERQNCINEYNANNCSYISIDDGPIRNNFCIEKKKCISSHTVYFHIILIKYIRSIFQNSFKNLSFVNTILFILSMIFIVKSITK
jgi:cbb3-type cytochrome oxidase subunit 3